MWSRMGKKAGGTQLHFSLWHQEAIASFVKFLDPPDWLASCRAGWISDLSSGRTGGMTSATKQRTLPSFAKSSEGKESACNAGDVGSICGLGRFPGEGIRNPLQYSCLGNPMDRGAWRTTVHGVAKYQTRLRSWACTEDPARLRLPAAPRLLTSHGLSSSHSSFSSSLQAPHTLFGECHPLSTFQWKFQSWGLARE